MQVRELWRYPVKSCQGEMLQAMGVTPYGPFNDREFMVVDEGGNFLTQRQHPVLALVKVQITSAYLAVSTEGLGKVLVDLTTRFYHTRQVRVWDDICTGFECSPEADKFFSTLLGKKCYLVRQVQSNPRVRRPSALDHDIRVSFADGYHFLVISTGSLEALRSCLPADVPNLQKRFRPNLIIEATAGIEGCSRTLQIGRQVRLRQVKPCSRCGIPDINPETGERDNAVGPTLHDHWSDNEGTTYFGNNYIVERGGVIRPNDEVTAT